MKQRISMVLFAAMAIANLVNCASRPEKIEAITVSDAGYRVLSCDELAAEAVRVRTELEAATTRQKRAVADDAVGVLLIGIPLGSIAGHDQEHAISRLKGEQAAVERAQKIKACT